MPTTTAGRSIRPPGSYPECHASTEHQGGGLGELVEEPPHLMVLTAEEGTPSRDALRILASWTTEETEGLRVSPAEYRDS
jgi:hypothetical protein